MIFGNAKLTAAQQTAVDRCIAAARQSSGIHTEDLPDGSQAYAYSQGHGGIAWGLNRAGDGMCIARGVKR